MKTSIIIAVLLGAFVIAQAKIDLSNEFASFIKKYNKPYANDPVEKAARFENFKLAYKHINRIQQADKQASYGITKFADMSPEEFDTKILSKTKTSGQALAQSCLANGVTAPKMDASSIPDSFDWRTKGVVTPVKDQGQCGSCWAFSTIGVIESQYALKGNNLTQFSEQELVDCSHGCCLEEGQTVCNSGCDGGWQWNAYIDVMSWGGVELETEYPYTAADGSCQRTQHKSFAPIKNFTCISGPQAADENQMAAYLVANGPIAIAVDASPLQYYFGGIVDPWFPNFECDPTQLDHALLIVGYGVEHSEIWGDTPYWIVKNSWGADWGESGYFRILRGKGVCGINNAVSSVLM